MIGFLAAATFYSPSSASSRSSLESFAAVRIGVGGATHEVSPANGLGIPLLRGSQADWRSMMLVTVPFLTEDIEISAPAVRAPGCTDPAVLCLGETATAVVTNAPLRADFRERRIQWIAPDGTVPHMWEVNEDPETDTYTFETSGVFAQVGKWAVRTINNRGGGVVVAEFQVVSPSDPSVDLQLTMTGPTTIAANTNVSYDATIFNYGPDEATNVTLVNPVPYNTTFVSATAPAGFSCVAPLLGEVGEITCTGETLGLNDSAAFTFTFNANVDVTNGAGVYNAAK
ncbi:MAG TPA: hypothetical protein VMS31_07780, partial [Pyrinomonadaceae bacterium]|nr:hypothetical protein [Pyrinomonadaceae bacterium]